MCIPTILLYYVFSLSSLMIRVKENIAADSARPMLYACTHVVGGATQVLLKIEISNVVIVMLHLLATLIKYLQSSKLLLYTVCFRAQYSPLPEQPC